MSDVNEEKSLIADLKKGNLAGFDGLFRKYVPRLIAFADSYLHDTREAEGIAQEVFMKIWETRETVDETRSFGNYVFVIAKHLILNRIRKQKSERRYIEQELSFAETGANKTEHQVLFNELKEIIDQAINAMPPRRKEVFILSRQKGMSHGAIAKKLDISVKTVEAQIRLAIRDIRDSLKKHR